MKRLSILMWIGFMGCTTVWAAPAGYDLSVKETRLELESRSPLHGFSGRAAAIQGHMTADVAAGELTGPTQILIPIDQIRTGNTARDHALAYTLRSGTQKEIRFTAVSVSEVDPAKKQYRLAGRLAIGGVERDTDIPVKASIQEGRIEVDGETRLSLKAFKLEPPPLSRMMGLNDEVGVKFHAVWEKAAGK